MLPWSVMASITRLQLTRNKSTKHVSLDMNVVEHCSTNFKCDQFVYTNTTEKGLLHHIGMKHRVSQVDGNIDLEQKESLKNVTNVILMTPKALALSM